MKQFIKFLSIAAIAFLLLTTNRAFAGNVTFIKEYIYQASEIDSKISSRAIALEQVKRLILEKVGVYLISETEVKDFKLTKDQVTVLAAGVVSTEILKEKWDGVTYYVKAKISVDPDEIAKSINALMADRQKTKELEDIRRKANDYLEAIEKLKKEIAGLKQDTKKQEQQYATTVKKLGSLAWFEKGYGFGISGNSKEAINAYSKAIEVDPQNDAAYNNRGTAYDKLGNYQQAISDFNKAIELNPRNDAAYNNRGSAYSKLGNYQQAIGDYNKAIELTPQYAIACYNRGNAYGRLGNYPQAINDYSKAIELYPQFEKAYFNRGSAYNKLGNYQQAISDYNKTIELNSRNDAAYINRGTAYKNLENYTQAIDDYNRAIQLNPQAIAYYNRGNIYHVLGKYQYAIDDFNKAIELNPQYVEAYYNRGIAYHWLNNKKKAIEDYKIAAKLGYKEAQDFLREAGIGWH